MKNPFIESIEFVCFAALNKLMRSFSYRAAGQVGAFLGGMAYAIATPRRAVALSNLAHAFPDISHNDRKRIALGAFKNYGIALCEMMWVGGKSEEVLKKTVRPLNPEVLQAISAGGQGVILLSAHFGNWEFLPHGFRLQVGKPESMIVQRQRNRRIDAMIDAGRTRWGNETIAMGVSSREVFATLQRGAMVLILGDQSGPKESVFVDFFGRPAATHRGASAFSLKTGAPIVLVLLVRQNDGTYEATIEEVDKSGLDDYTEDNIVELTKRHVAVLERHIRLHPDQWLWMHKRWKHTEYHQSAKRVAEEA